MKFGTIPDPDIRLGSRRFKVKRLFVFCMLLLMTGCPAKRQILFLKLTLEHDVSSSDFLKAAGSGIEAKNTDKMAGYNFLPEKCDHRYFKNKNESSVLGICLIKRNVYIYSLLADRGNNPQGYLNDSYSAEALALSNQYKTNAEKFLSKLKVGFKSDGYKVDNSNHFIKMLMDEAKSE